jgi:hypothetical protein
MVRLLLNSLIVLLTVAADAKYHYEFWRPITAIRNGDIDGIQAPSVIRPGSRSTTHRCIRSIRARIATKAALRPPSSSARWARPRFRRYR